MCCPAGRCQKENSKGKNFHPKNPDTHHFLDNLIGDVPLVLALIVGGGVAEDHWSFGHVQHLVHHFDWDVCEIDEHPQPVHLHNDLLMQANSLTG